MSSRITGILSVVATLWLAGCTSSPAVKGKQAPPAPVATAPATRPPVVDPAASPAVTPTPPTPKSGGYYLDDGPEASPPDLKNVTDAVPRPEPLHRYANRTYVALGKTYRPDTSLSPYKEEGMASWYGKRFHGKKTATGEIYDMYGMTAAHPTLPIPSYVRVTSLSNGKSVIVRVNDRGPFSKNRLIDLSYVAAHKLGYIGAGSTLVRVESVDPLQYDVEGTQLSSGVYLQVGAFLTQSRAHKLREKVQVNIESPAPPVHVVRTGGLHRVTLGPYTTAEAADIDSTRLQENLGLTAIKLER